LVVYDKLGVLIYTDSNTKKLCSLWCGDWK